MISPTAVRIGCPLFSRTHNPNHLDQLGTRDQCRKYPGIQPQMSRMMIHHDPTVIPQILRGTTSSWMMDRATCLMMTLVGTGAPSRDCRDSGTYCCDPPDWYPMVGQKLFPPCEFLSRMAVGPSSIGAVLCRCTQEMCSLWGNHPACPFRGSMDVP